jgi:exosortase A-associated hydrolase 2
MRVGAADSFEAFYLTGCAGRLFSVFRGPSDPDRARNVGVLYVPPFADEMNKVRRQAALQARQLAQRGFGVLAVDLYGTGDSDGEFVDARWETWCRDLQHAADWLCERGASSLVLWGVRSGALLASDVAHMLGDRVKQLVLWQPVPVGKVFLSQFLRLRAAAEMLAGDGGIGTGELREQLANGNTVEIAGYELHPDLAAAIEGRSLRDMALSPGLCVDWFEIVASADQPAPPSAEQVVNRWAKSGSDVELIAVRGSQFWATTEIVVVDELLNATSDIVGRYSNASD